MGADTARAVNADITSIIVRLDAGLYLSDAEQRITFDRMQEKMHAVMRVFSCCSAMDAVPPPGPVPPCPRAPSTGVVRPTAGSSHGTAPPRGPRLPSGAFVGGSSSSQRSLIPRPNTQTRGIFASGASSSHAGGTGPTVRFYDDDLHGAPDQEILGSSQLGGAPKAHTQEQPLVTPVQEGRAGRAVPPDRLTYSQGHVRAQGRRDRGKRPRQ
nr:uncharacterized protein LOC107279784 [Oryza sativa Japonica Group]